MTTETPETFCPACGHPLDRATAVKRQKITPRSGDLSLCINCGEVLKFTDGLTLVPLDPGEFYVLPAAVKGLVQSIRKFIIERKGA